MNRIPLPAGIVGEILNTSADATIVSDEQGIIRVANQHADELFGYTTGELVGQAIEVLIPEEFRARHLKLRDKFNHAPRARPMVAGLELEGQRKDGTTFRAEIALTPIETDDGLIVTSTVREIDEVDESEAYFKHLLDSAPDAMVIIDDHGKIAIVNRQAEEMFGFDRGEMLGQAVEMLLPDRLQHTHVGHRESFAH